MFSLNAQCIVHCITKTNKTNSGRTVWLLIDQSQGDKHMWSKSFVFGWRVQKCDFFLSDRSSIKAVCVPAACVGDILEFALEYLVGCQTESSKFHHPAKCHLHSILCEQWQWVIPHTKHKTKYSLIEDSTWQQQQQNSTVDARWKRNLMWKKSWSATNAFYTLPATIKQYRWLKHMLNGFSGLEISVSHTHTLCHTVSVCFCFKLLHC